MAEITTLKTATDKFIENNLSMLEALRDARIRIHEAIEDLEQVYNTDASTLEIKQKALDDRIEDFETKINEFAEAYNLDLSKYTDISQN